MTTTSEISTFCLQSGVSITYAGAYQIATGRRHGADTETQLAIQRLLQDPGFALTHKRSFYAAIATGLVENREYGSVGILRSEGYTQSVAKERNMSDQHLRRLVRAMRGDLLSRPKSEDTEGVFRQCVEELASDLDQLQPSWTPRTMTELVHQHSGNMSSFYKQLYVKSGSRRNIGMWTPYEAPLLYNLYAAGDAEQALSDFDVLSLQPHAKWPQRYHKVPCDDHVMLAHRGVLLHDYPPLLHSERTGTIYSRNIVR